MSKMLDPGSATIAAFFLSLGAAFLSEWLFKLRAKGMCYVAAAAQVTFTILAVFALHNNTTTLNMSVVSAVMVTFAIILKLS